MAGFEVIIYGRFWVIAEALKPIKAHKAHTFPRRDPYHAYHAYFPAPWRSLSIPDPLSAHIALSAQYFPGD
jgi:hypothetical protein